MKRSIMLGWTTSISVIVTIILMVIASLLHHALPSLGTLGLVGLASIVGGVATFGGIVTGLIGLYSLTSINEKIQDAIADEKNVWQDQLNKQLSIHMRAFSEYNRGIAEPNIRKASECMETALELEPELPLVSEYMGNRFANATFRWAWHQIDRSQNFKVRLSIYGGLDGEAYIEEGDYTHDAIKWLESVKTVDVDLAIHWMKLAKLYALVGDSRKVISSLRLAVKANQQNTNYDVKDIGILLWNCTGAEEIKEICEIISYQPPICLTESLLGNVLHRDERYEGTMRPLLAVRRRGSLMFKSEATFSPTIYYVGGSLSNNGETHYMLQWYGDDVVRYPKQDDDPWDIDKMLRVVNDWFVTVGEVSE